MKKYRATLKKVYKKDVEVISEFDFFEDDNEDAIAHLNRIIDNAKEKFGVEMFVVYLEEVKS